MVSTRSVSLLTIAWLSIGVPTVAGGPPTFLYSLDGASSYAAGCFGVEGQVPQCRCAIALASTFGGSFGLTQSPAGGELDEAFEVSDILWTIEIDSVIEVTGAGLYERGTDTTGVAVQRLTLDLFFNGKGPVAFDSGIVTDDAPTNPPVIEIPISDGLGCPGRRMTVSASPSVGNPADVAPTGGDGVVDILDLIAVLADWGLTGTSTDIDDSGVVGIADLLAVLAAWSG